MNVVMIGAGYVGLTTGACLAELGHDVCCVDVDDQKIMNIDRGRLPIYEPGLAELIAANRGRGRLNFSCDLPSAVSVADIVFIAVGTPSRPDGDIDLSHVETAARDIAPHLRPDTLIVIKSTVVAGTARRVRQLIAQQRQNRPVAVASNPEFLREGSAIADFMNADRIVAGSDEEEAGAKLAALYRPLVERGIPYVRTGTINAELIKYAANAFLALKIGFINDVADLCEGAEGDVAAVAEGIGLDRRIGSAFLSPGPGFGGSCFPKDTRAFAATGRRSGAQQTLIETLIRKNDERKRLLAQRILQQLGSPRSGKRAAILGTAFKANTDDMREAAALTIVPLLQKAGVEIAAHDPRARATASVHLTDVHWCDSPYTAAKDADLIVILTEWPEYRHLDLGRIARAMRGRRIIDYRNILEPKKVVQHGLEYSSLGRPKLTPSRLQKTAAQAESGSRWTDIAASPL